jgi:O-antigen/teichoic acid export membrane protein
MNLTTKTTQGISWSVISQVTRLLLQVVITAILARLLTPADFGLIAMVVVFTGFVLVFSDFGLTAALIQYKELKEEHLSSSFWINVLTGFFLTILLSASAPLIAHFYGKDKLTLIVIVLATTSLPSVLFKPPSLPEKSTLNH